LFLLFYLLSLLLFCLFLLICFFSSSRGHR
jgi:hypothetical protein